MFLIRLFDSFFPNKSDLAAELKLRLFFYQALSNNNNTLSMRHVDAFQQSKALMNHKGFILMRAYYYSFIRHNFKEGDFIFRQTLNTNYPGYPVPLDVQHFEIIHNIKHSQKLPEMLDKFNETMLQDCKDWIETLFVARDLRKYFHLIPSTHSILKVKNSSLFNKTAK